MHPDVIAPSITTKVFQITLFAIIQPHTYFSIYSSYSLKAMRVLSYITTSPINLGQVALKVGVSGLHFTFLQLPSCTVAWKFSLLKYYCGSMKPQKFIERIFQKMKLVQE